MNKTKKAIYEATIKIFSERGYDGATMDEIANAAGVAKGTLYYHFKSKEEIFKYTIEKGFDLIKSQIESNANTQKDPLAKLKELCKIQFNLVYQNKEFFKVIMSQLWGQHSRQLELRLLIERYIINIQQYLEEAMNEGIIKKGEASFMAYTLFGSICSAAIYELINKDDKDTAELIDNLLFYFLKGIQI